MRFKKRYKIIRAVLTQEFLEYSYNKLQKSLTQISNETKISKRTVLDYLIKFSIPRRKTGCPKGHKQSVEHKQKHSATLKRDGNHVNLLHKKGKNHPNFIDGRTTKVYYCKICNKEINWQTATKGSGMCGSCSAKERFKDPRNHPVFGKLFKQSGWKGKRIYYKDICFRSSWEVAYAKYLDFNNIIWQYEPKAFDLGNTTYRPDFYLPETNEYVEIKGWWSDKFDSKIKKFKKLYNNINLIIYEKGALNFLGILDESYLLSPSVIPI